MIFFAEEPTPKASGPESGPTPIETSAAPQDRGPDAAAESPPAAQPALFESTGAVSRDDMSDEQEPAAAVEEPPAEAAQVEATAQALPVETEALPPVASGEVTEERAVIKVIGVGGGGGNAVNRMIDSGVTGVDFIAANTDAQVLELSRAPVKIQLGIERTGGLGCGGDPEVGRAAAHDDINRLIDVLAGADMVFITVGEGGGTGTGAAPVIACVAQEINALCVAVATKPLTVEGKRRRTTSNDGIRELKNYVDTLICVPNDRVVEVYGDLKIREAFRCADDVVRQAVQGISDLIQVPGEINLDFADVRSAMRLSGDAVMGIGQASGDGRVEEATQAAISSPLLEDTSIQGASSIIVNVTGGESLTLNEIQRAVEVVREAVAPDGAGAISSAAAEPGDNILIGTALDPKMDETGEIKVTVVATGFPDRGRAGATPNDFANYTSRATGTFGPGSGTSSAAPIGRAPGGRVGRTIPKLENFPGGREPASVHTAAATADMAADQAGGQVSSPSASGTRLVIDEPMSLPEDVGDDRWGDLETPPYLHRRGRG